MAKRVVVTDKPNLSETVTPVLLGQFIRYKRTTMGMTLEDAASLCCVSKQAYQNLEKGFTSTRFETLFKVLSALGIRLELQDKEQKDDWR